MLRLHAGIGQAANLDSMLASASRPDAAQRWRRATSLIIDEVLVIAQLQPVKQTALLVRLKIQYK